MKKEEIKVLLIEDDSNLGAITADYLAGEDAFYILEEQLFDAIIASESPGIHYLNYDTANISVSYHAS